MMRADYQVFLCHRGPEVKLNVVNALHHMLRSNGIKSFVDSYEIMEGTDVNRAIMEAIKESKVHIVFLSPDFASSKWCLNELLEIMLLQSAAGISSVPHKPLVLPVFYDVKPSVVRHQPKGSTYDLDEKRRNSTPKERAQWSNALKELSYLKGIEYDTRTMPQMETLQEIVSVVKSSLNENRRSLITNLADFTSRLLRMLQEMVKLGRSISLSASEDNRASVVVCYNHIDDVHPAFIAHLQETFNILGLDACVLSEDEIVSDNRRLPKAQVIIRIISKSPHVRYFERTLVYAFIRYFERRVVYAFVSEPKVFNVLYGLEPTIESTSSTPFSFTANVEKSTCQLNKVEIKHMVKEVMDFLNEGNEKRMRVTDFPVGLSQRLNKIESRIVRYMSSIQRSHQCFGLLGMAGVGKTTTAKSIYNRMHKQFQRSAFILDARTEMAASGLEAIQEKILHNLLAKQPETQRVNDVEYGKAQLTFKLRGINAFVVLDDLDTKAQVDALYYPLSLLGPKSIVIITSRDREILEYASANEIFEIEALSKENSEWLFCWHAFMRPVPPAHLTLISEKMIEACEGIPLSLEVLGSHLSRDSNIRFWEESLEFLKHNEEIFSLLRISLNNLESMQREAFLDICCFLIGREEDFVCGVLEACYGMGETILRALKNKCLITIKKEKGITGMERRIQMQNLVQVMGRRIILQEEKTRAWYEKTTIDMLKDARVLSGLWGLSVAGVDMRDGLVKELFANVRCDKLRWLRWACEKLPAGVCSTQLRVLDLSHSGIRELPAALPNLQILELEGCKDLRRFPTAIGTSMPLLRRLGLRDCEKLEGLDSSVTMLSDLRYLNLQNCRRITPLPEDLRSLCSLRELSLEFERVESLSLPANLRKLRLYRYGNLEIVDTPLPNLEEFHLIDCPKPKKLPTLGSLLLQLVINDCNGPFEEGYLMFNGARLSSLRELHLSCERGPSADEAMIKTLSVPTNLRQLRLVQQRILETVFLEDRLPPAGTSWLSLEELHLFRCPNLRKLPRLGGSLLVLKIDDCDRLQGLWTGASFLKGMT